MSKTIKEAEDEIVDEFSLFDSWDDKYEYIIDLGKKLPPLNNEYKKDENKVRGCQSTVWLVANEKDGKIFGLGSNDAGGCLVSLIATFLYFYHQEELNHNVVFAASAEEEISGVNGIELVLPYLGKIDFGVVGDCNEWSVH